MKEKEIKDSKSEEMKRQRQMNEKINNNDALRKQMQEKEQHRRL